MPDITVTIPTNKVDRLITALENKLILEEGEEVTLERVQLLLKDHLVSIVRQYETEEATKVAIETIEDLI